MNRVTSALGLALALVILSAPQVAAQDTCVIMGKETANSSGEACPADLFTVLSNLKSERVVMKTDPATGEEEEVTEVHTFNTFAGLADKAGFGAYLRGETPPKVHGEGVAEGTMTVFAVSDQMLGEEAIAHLTELSMSQDPKNAEMLRKFVGAHIVVVPETRGSMWNGAGQRRTIAGAGVDAKFDTLYGARRINAVEIYEHDNMSTNWVIHVMSDKIVLPPTE